MQVVIVEFFERLYYYYARLVSDISAKALISGATIAFEKLLAANWNLFEIYWFLTCADLVFGVANSIKNDTFKTRRLANWCIKTFTYISCMLIVGSLNHAVNFACHVNTTLIADLCLLVVICTEATSVIDNMDKLKLPVHPIIKQLIRWINSMSIKKLKSFLNSFSKGEDDNNDV